MWFAEAYAMTPGYRIAGVVDRSKPGRGRRRRDAVRRRLAIGVVESASSAALSLPRCLSAGGLRHVSVKDLMRGSPQPCDGIK